MKIRELDMKLQTLSTFEKPKINLEQYSTSSHIASRMLYVAQTQFCDIENQCVADLGTGCGILSLGASLLGAAYVMGFDIDESAIKIWHKNRQKLKMPIESVCCDIMSFLPGHYENFFHTVLMNPPFGTKHNHGMDIQFLDVASKISCKVIYSLHKTSTRNHILQKAQQFGLKSQVIAELRFDVPSTYKFHKKKSVDIAVDFIRFLVNK
ncbi:methyltransferase-like protein 5 [Copidosoma floridanum]|uniref:methyltransferase-like protein 5 n=1 Tax=Copidosoma floridanum TaxID=29053 RepID=UPI0006C9774C|nr:methyltransferase-like protein 5 [Copidosoma floridanum]